VPITGEPAETKSLTVIAFSLYAGRTLELGLWQVRAVRGALPLRSPASSRRAFRDAVYSKKVQGNELHFRIYPDLSRFLCINISLVVSDLSDSS